MFLIFFWLNTQDKRRKRECVLLFRTLKYDVRIKITLPPVYIFKAVRDSFGK